MLLRRGRTRHAFLVLVTASALGAVCGSPSPAQSAEQAANAGRSPGPRNGSQAYLHYTLGRLLEVSGALSDALVQYRRADSIDADRCEIATAIGRTLYSLGRLEDAQESAEQALGSCPDNVEAAALLAEILLVSDEAAAAGRVLRDAALRDDAPREVALLYGQSLLSQGRLEEGEEYLRRRSEADSLDARAASLRGRALLLLGDSEGAIRELKRAARLDPRDRAVVGMLSRLFIALERPEEGVPLLEGLLRGGGATPPEYVSLAAGYSMLGEDERALAVLDSAASRFGETRAILRARGAAYYNAGHLESAVAVYERLLEINPESVTALNFIAYTLADEDRDLDRALSYARRAVALEEDNPLLRDTLGWTEFRLGRLEDARRELSLAIELGGDNPVILEHLGDVLWEMGLADDARAVWNRALAVSPGNSSLLERVARAAAGPGSARREPDPPEGR